MPERNVESVTKPDALPRAEGLLNACLSRRRFLALSAATISLVAIEGLLPGRLVTAERAEFDSALIGRLSSLRVGEPVSFAYPFDHPNMQNLLVKLGVRAGGGIGPEQDVVAFNTICPHMGFPLEGTFNPEHQVLGPCGWHLSTYDLTRHGMIVSGHATSGLPQILLEARGDEIYATGVQSLIFGFNDNELDPTA